MSGTDHPLRRCIGDEAEFRASTWGRRPLHRASGGSFCDLLDVDDVEDVLSLLGRRPGFRLVADGVTLPIESYTAPTRVAGRVVDEVADVDRILDLVHGGATVVLQGLQRTWLPLAEFCAALEAEISHPVQANAYLSPAGAAAFRRHVDGHAVFALQVGGRKVWSVDGLGDVELVPGDVLYLPAGTPHEARSADTFSLHLTIGVLAVTWRQVVRRALADGALDEPLPLGFARPEHATELAAAVGSALSAAREVLDGLNVPAVAEEEAGRIRRRRRTRTSGRLRAAVDLSSVREGTRLRRTTSATVSEDADRVTIEFVDRRLSLPAFTGAALDAVARGAEFVVGALPGLDADSQTVLARRLLREGLLVPVDRPAAPATLSPG